MTTTNTNTVHVFEAANLGKGPFKLHHVTGEGGNCQFCNTSIVWRFYIKGQDEGMFFVGSDCVMKTGDAGLMKKVQAEVKARQNEARAKRENEKLALLDKLMADPAVQAKLSKAHPNRYYASQGKTMLDYYRWTLSYASKSAKLAALKAIQSLP